MQDTDNLRFPSIIKGAAGEFAGLYATYLEVPEHFLFMGYLTCLGSCLADRLTLASEIAPQPRLYVILLGESADDRKSTALNKCTDFFREAVVEDGFYVCHGVGSAEGLQKRLQESPRLLLCLDEFRQFVSKCKIEASVLLPCVNTLFESNRYESRTKKTDIHLENAYLSLLAASTTETYERTWSSAFTAIGFNNRLFLVPGSGERKYSFPAKVPDAEKYYQRQRLGGILRHVGSGLELDISSEARELYHQWYMGLERSIHAKRLDTYAMRLMGLLAVNELKSEIDIDVVEMATALADWQLKVRRIHDPIDADNEIARTEEKIRRLLSARGGLNDRDLRRFANVQKHGLWILSTAKKNLQRAGEIRFDRSEKRYFLKEVS
jgi:hypothetical protein